MNFKDDKGHKFDDMNEVQYLYKTFFVNTQHKNKLELNPEIIARTQDIQDV